MSSQEEVLRQPETSLVGVSLPRVDSKLKVSGKALYTRDMSLPNMLYARIKRSPFSHARILRIDMRAAREALGVKAVITGEDFPEIGTEDTPALARGEILYANQAVVAVAAETRALANGAVDLIEVEYEELPPILDVEAAMLPNPPSVISHPGEKTESPNVGRHLKIRKGDVEEGFRHSGMIVENTYTTAMESHFQLEPLTFLAQPDPDGGVTIWGTSAGPHKIQAEVSTYIGVDRYLVRGRVPYMGGWFGSKEESHVAAVCAMLAMKTGRPVKLELSREETMTATGVRHSSRISIRDGLSKDGKILAREIRALYNGGAYGSLGNNVMRNSLFAACAVYDIPNLKIDTYRVYTNLPPGTTKRAPLGLQMVWAIESQMDLLASRIGSDPIEYRKWHLLQDGQENAMGELVEDASFERCLNETAKSIGWGVKPQGEGVWKAGKGVSLAAKWGPVGPHQAMVRVRENGKVEIWAELVENGAGIYTSIAQLVATEFGISAGDVIVMPFVLGYSDSSTSGLSGGASASRQLVNVGRATQLACQDAKRKIAERGARILHTSPEGIEVSGKRVFAKTDPRRSIMISDLFTQANILAGKLAVSGLVEGMEFVGYGTVFKKAAETDPETGRTLGGRISPYYIPVCQAAEVVVNIETGLVRIRRIAAAMDVGKAINPEIVKAQIIGSVAMGASAALGEEMVVSNGKTANANLADYKLLNVLDAPDIDPLIIETAYHDGPYGAKGAGEPSTLPTAAAIRNAIHDAVGVWLNDLPMTPERVLEALSKRVETHA
ncbi:MAG: xanthine dehydrogenase family protein molybdopterin-binding subunit [Thaumarchaeota archaeon]|nr:xanthine dehydrogenase family protein molybdopterin-binding subunit [Nitrososphaerota archaeon]